MGAHSHGIKCDGWVASRSPLQTSVQLTLKSTDSISTADSPISRPHCPRRAIQASKRIRGSLGYRLKFQTGWSTRTKGQLGSINWQMTEIWHQGHWVFDPLVGKDGSYFNPMWLLQPSTPQAKQKMAGRGSGRLTFLLSLGRWVPSMENPTFLLQFQVHLGVRQVALPHCTAWLQEGLGWMVLGNHSAPFSRNTLLARLEGCQVTEDFSTINFMGRQDLSHLEWEFIISVIFCIQI